MPHLVRPVSRGSDDRTVLSLPTGQMTRMNELYVSGMVQSLENISRQAKGALSRRLFSMHVIMSSGCVVGAQTCYVYSTQLLLRDPAPLFPSCLKSAKREARKA